MNADRGWIPMRKSSRKSTPVNEQRARLGALLGVLRMLAGAQRLMGREDEALSTLDRAVGVAPQNGDLRAERAMLFSLLGWFPQAEAALKEAEHRGADPVQTALVRATTARQQGD